MTFRECESRLTFNINFESLSFLAFHQEKCVSLPQDIALFSQSQAHFPKFDTPSNKRNQKENRSKICSLSYLTKFFIVKKNLWILLKLIACCIYFYLQPIIHRKVVDNWYMHPNFDPKNCCQIIFSLQKAFYEESVLFFSTYCSLAWFCDLLSWEISCDVFKRIKSLESRTTKFPRTFGPAPGARFSRVGERGDAAATSPDNPLQKREISVKVGVWKALNRGPRGHFKSQILIHKTDWCKCCLSKFQRRLYTRPNFTSAFCMCRPGVLCSAANANARGPSEFAALWNTTLQTFSWIFRCRPRDTICRLCLSRDRSISLIRFVHKTYRAFVSLTDFESSHLPSRKKLCHANLGRGCRSLRRNHNSARNIPPNY